VAPPPPGAAAAAGRGPAIVAWAEGGGTGGVTIAALGDDGIPADVRTIPVGPVPVEGEGGHTEVVVDGLAFGPAPGLVLLLASHGRAPRHPQLISDPPNMPPDHLLTIP